MTTPAPLQSAILSDKSDPPPVVAPLVAPLVAAVSEQPQQRKRRPYGLARRQDGVIIFFTLVAVVLLLIASVALVRSFDTSLSLAGNMAFKRDLLNQSERGVAAAITLLSPGGPLALRTTRESDDFANNYSATTLKSDPHGIPDILLSEAKWTASGMTKPDIVDATSKITVRMVIDRLCNTTGEVTNINCAIAAPGQDKGGSAWVQPRAGGSSIPVYRVSIRVTGPRNTQTYVQSTLSL